MNIFKCHFLCSWCIASVKLYKIRSEEVLLIRSTSDTLLLNINFGEFKYKKFNLQRQNYSFDKLWTLGADGKPSRYLELVSSDF